jgi:hypothetical protein
MSAQPVMPIAFSVGNSDTLYYNADELKTFSPEYFKGTSKSIRVIIIRKNIPQEAVIYASFSRKNGWALSNEASKPAKLLIAKEWIDVNMFKKSTDGNNSQELNIEYVPAPEIIQLNDDEKFRDYHGNILDIANMNNTITNMFNTIDFKNKEIEYLMEKNETLKEKLETLKETAADVLKSNTKISDLTIQVRDMEIEKLKLEISALNLK